MNFKATHVFTFPDGKPEPIWVSNKFLAWDREVSVQLASGSNQMLRDFGTRLTSEM